MLPKIPLTHCEFAEQYITMPRNGPRGGERFRADWQPVLRVVWEELDKGCWRELACTAPVQASKSFGILVVPTLRDVVELRYEPIIGVPEADMFADKWDKDFKPVFDDSPDLSWLKPKTGSGVNGGRVKDRVTLANSVDIKVMSRGGKATNKAGYTSPRLRITEAAGFTEGSKAETDAEADAYRQLLGRLGAFDMDDPRRFVAIEGTGTIEDHLPWRLRGSDEDDELISSRSRFLSPCPHCEAWISPEREHLVGWQTAKSAVEAYERARFICPACRLEIDDEQRKMSMQDVCLVHHGQALRADGTIEGDSPNVFRLWVRWSAWHNLLIKAGNAAVKEWEAAKIPEGTEDRENAERDLCQKSWAVPYKSSLVEQEPLNPAFIRRRRDEWERGVLPPDTVKVTVGVDMGKWNSWWLVLAARENGVVHVPAYGNFNVVTSNEDEVESHLKAALHEIIDETFERGFRQASDVAMRLADSTWVDRGWMKQHVQDVVRTYGTLRDNRYRAAKGFGATAKRRDKQTTVGQQYHHPSKRTKTILQIGNRWYSELDVVDKIVKYNFDADYWKLKVQEWLRTAPGKKGSLVFFRADHPNEHSQLSFHLAAEQLEDVQVPGKGLVKKWVKRGRNHWLDCAAMAAAALDYVGFRLVDVPEPEPEEHEADSADTGNWYARMRNAI